MLDRNVIIYPVDNDKLGKGYLYEKDGEDNKSFRVEEAETDVVKWVLANKKRAGATTKVFRNAKCLYLAIRINDTVYGIMGIFVEKKAKEEAALIAQNEKLRANLLRTISHDLRMPLTSKSAKAPYIQTETSG